MIYLDYNASTPVDPRVLEAMMPYFTEIHGNPSSAHAIGRRVRQGVEDARGQVADMIGAKSSEIVFTSGGTESSNHVIRGVAHGRADRGKHIVTSAIEHPATLQPCTYLEENGYEVTYVGVDATGMIDPDEVARAVRADTILISIMHANNEVGTIQPIAEIAKMAREQGIAMHSDAAQTCGKIRVHVDELGVDFLSIAGHKLYAPQGIGALYIRDGTELESFHLGAGHERGRRAGTEAVQAIVGLGAAATLAGEEVNGNAVRSCRDSLCAGLEAELGDQAVVLGHPETRLPNTLAMGFRGRIGADVLATCPEVAASTGAACHAAQRKRSAVLAAMNVPEDVAFGAVRFSVGRFTSQDEIDRAVPLIVRAVREES
ncbi:MAG: cysteine desulfurase family protein [Phycisphaerae bacterium]